MTFPRAATLLLSLLLPASLLSPLALAAQAATPPDPQAASQAQDHQTPAPKALAPASNSVNVTVAGKVKVFTVEDLLALPQVTVHVHNVQKNVDETYSGPLLSAVLSAAGLEVVRENESMLLHSTVVATGAYRYFVVYSVPEIEPSFSKNQTILAVMKSDLPNPEGKVELINTGDTNSLRWVRGLSGLTVMTLNQNK